MKMVYWGDDKTIWKVGDIYIETSNNSSGDSRWFWKFIAICLVLMALFLFLGWLYE